MKFDIRNQTRRTDLCLFILRATYYAMTVKKNQTVTLKKVRKIQRLTLAPLKDLFYFVLNMALKYIESGLSKHK